MLLCGLAPGTAWAGGLELLPGGTQSVSRGGAVAARPSDPMVLLHNPAGLTRLAGDQILLDVDVPLHRMCVNPYGYYGWGVYSEGPSEFGDPLVLDDPNRPTVGATYATTPLGEVCNSAPTAPLPQLAWTHRLGRDWAIGAGFLIPTAVGGLQYGGADGTVETAYGPRPTPTRYSLVQQEVLFGLNPTFGVAHRILPELSVGATLQVLMARVRSTSVQNGVSGTQPSTDWFTAVEAEDYFIPSVTVSVSSKPIDTIDLMAAFKWTDDFSGPGSVVVETNTFHQGGGAGFVPYENDPIALSNITVRFPWVLTTGVRYGAPLPASQGAALGGPGDPLDTELWDIEIDGAYSFNERASRASAAAGEDVVLISRSADGTTTRTGVSLEDLSQIDVDRHLKDSIAVRLGGSYAVVPRTAAVQAGVFYETRGVDLAYADIDTFAFQRVGFGIGAILRLGDVDLRVGYGHIASETVELAPPPHQNVEDAVPGRVESGYDQRVGGTFDAEGTRNGGTVLRDPDAPPPGGGDAEARKTQKSAIATTARPERIINAGRYTAAFHVVSVGVVYRF
jgi:hypothetical protein